MDLIRVKAFPGSKKEKVEETAPNVLRVFVRESAERNMANKAIVKAVAAYCGIPEKRLVMKTGHRGSNKTLTVLGTR